MATLFFLPGLWWGLPHASQAQFIHGWDVDGVAGIAVLSEFYNLLISPKPDWYVAYPLFHYLVLGFVMVPYLGYLLLTGGLSAPSSVYPFGFQDPVSSLVVLALIGRIVTLMMAVGVVLAAYQTAKTVWDRRTGILAALLVSLLGPVVFYARTGNLDIPLLFWMALGIWVAAQISVNGFTLRRGVVLGAMAALSVATKDQAYGAWLPGLAILLYSHVASVRKAGPRPGWARWQGPLAALLAGMLIYSLASGLIISPSRFLAHVRFVLNYKNTFYNVAALNLLVPATPSGYLRLAGEMFTALSEAMGVGLVALALAGLLATFRRTSFTWLLIAMLAGHLLLVILPVRHMQYRYILFPAYILALFAARSTMLGWDARSSIRWVTAAFFGLAFAWLAVRAVDLTYQMIADSRYPAGNWLSQQLRAGDRVAYFGANDQLPGLPGDVIVERLPEDGTAELVLRQNGYDFVIISPDWSSDAGMFHSRFLSPPVYARLQDGSLGYERVAYFANGSLLQRPLKYLAFVNPPVQIFRPRAALYDD